MLSRSQHRQHPDLGMAGSVVADLIAELPKDVEYRLFFDNLFTSLPIKEL